MLGKGAEHCVPCHMHVCKAAFTHTSQYVCLCVFTGSGNGRVPVLDAINNEASTLQDAELDLRINSKFDRVFGNAIFEPTSSPSRRHVSEAVASDRSSPGSPKTPGTEVKLNNLFGDASTRHREDSITASPSRSHRDGTPDRAKSIFGRKRESGSSRAAASEVPEGHTPIQDFNTPEGAVEDEEQMAVVAAKARPPPPAP